MMGLTHFWSLGVRKGLETGCEVINSSWEALPVFAASLVALKMEMALKLTVLKMERLIGFRVRCNQYSTFGLILQLST